MKTIKTIAVVFFFIMRILFTVTMIVFVTGCTVANGLVCLDEACLDGGAGEGLRADARVVGRADSGAAIYAEGHLPSADSKTLGADAKASMPDSSVVAADAKSTTPDQKVSTPDAKTASPDAKVAAADTKVSTPDAKVVKPDSKVTKPDSKVVTPDAKVTKPDTKVVSPDQKVTKPDTQAPDTVTWACTTASDCGTAGKCTYYTCSSAHKCVTNYRAYGYSCTDGDACTTSDVCDGAGTCEGTAKTCASPPNTQCYKATGTCSGGTCSYSYKASGTSCNDGDACTTSDVCDGAGTCSGTAKTCASPPNTQCYSSTGTCSGGTCSYSYKSSSTSCSDGYYCTDSDTCDGAGTCSGSAKNCGAGYTCDETSDACELTAQTGCADGTREGFVSETTFPYLAGCSGKWSVAGMSKTGTNTAGALCESGWHVCLDEADVKANTPSSMTAAYACKYYAAPSTTSYVFFATRQPSTGFGKCTSSGTNDVFGCGNLGDPPASGGCTVFNKFGSEDCLGLKVSGYSQAWYCGDNGGTTDNSDELTTVYKTLTSLGGVLCCYY